MEFEQLYKEYFTPVYLYIRQLSGDEHIAEEITSETFFKAMKSIDKFRNECDIRVWLCQIAKNTYYTYMKKHKHVENIDDISESNFFIYENSAEDVICKIEKTQMLRMLLHQLQEPYKEVFMWRVFGELSFKEIGKIYKKSDNWACVTYHRARKMIKKRLEATENEK